MSKPQRPRYCDECEEEAELHWNNEYREWLCDMCEEVMEEDQMIEESEEYGEMDEE